MNEIRFYKSTDVYGFFSNLFPAEIMFEGLLFRTAEHLYQWHKASNPEIKEWIRSAPFPRCAAIAGHGLFPYDVVSGWGEKKVEVMRMVLREKFRQHPKFAALLKETGDATIIEASSTDAFWGIGKSGKGKNMLGVLLMELRDELRKEADNATQ